MDLRSNGLSTLPAGIFTGLKKLRRLTLADNWIKDLPEEVFVDLLSIQVC
jgi:hypothetical protein